MTFCSLWRYIYVRDDLTQPEHPGNLHVAGLPDTADEDTVRQILASELHGYHQCDVCAHRQLFAAYGTVESVKDGDQLGLAPLVPVSG